MIRPPLLALFVLPGISYRRCGEGVAEAHEARVRGDDIGYCFRAKWRQEWRKTAGMGGTRTGGRFAILFVLGRRPAAGLTTLVSDKVNQWTLLVGMLPLALSVGAGSVAALPLDAREH